MKLSNEVLKRSENSICSFYFRVAGLYEARLRSVSFPYRIPGDSFDDLTILFLCFGANLTAYSMIMDLYFHFSSDGLYLGSSLTLAIYLLRLDSNNGFCNFVRVLVELPIFSLFPLCTWLASFTVWYINLLELAAVFLPIGWLTSPSLSWNGWIRLALVKVIYSPCVCRYSLGLFLWFCLLNSMSQNWFTIFFLCSEFFPSWPACKFPWLRSRISIDVAVLLYLWDLFRLWSY